AARLTFVEPPGRQRVVTSYEGELILRAAKHGAGEEGKLSVPSRFHVPLGATMMAQDGQKVARDGVLFTWDPYTNPIMTDVAGVVRFVDIVEDETVREELDELTGRRQRVIIEDREKKLHPHSEITPKRASRSCTRCPRASTCASTRAIGYAPGTASPRGPSTRTTSCASRARGRCRSTS